MGVFIWYEGGWDYDLIGINSIYKQPFLWVERDVL